MAKEKVKGKVLEQIICPDCGKVVDYNDIGKYKRGSPAEMMEMDLRDFIKTNASVAKNKIQSCYLRYLTARLFDGKLYKEYDLNGEKITSRYHKKPITKVRDLYGLTTGEIYAIPMVGKKTWRMLNEMLKNNNLPALKLPYKYTVDYPLGKGSYKK
jgi:hypothetical protein